MLTNKDYCYYDTQKSLMNIGFPMKAQSYDLGKGVKEYLPKIHLYDAQKWLREEKNIYVEVHIAFNMYFYELFKTDEYDKYCGIQKVLVLGTNGYESYEEALLEGIKEAVKILKEK